MSLQKLQRMQQIILLPVLLSIPFVAFAEGEKIICPATELIQKSVSTVNTVFFMNGSYVVWSLNWAFTDANMHWQVMSYVTAPGFHAAFEAGLNSIKHLNKRVDEYAMDAKDYFVCRYAGNQGMVAAMSFKNDNAESKLTALDAKTFNSNMH